MGGDEKKSRRSDRIRSPRLMWQDDATLRKLNATPEQRTKLREAADSRQTSGMTAAREPGEKALAVLTAEQRKKLEERMDQQEW